MEGDEGVGSGSQPKGVNVNQGSDVTMSTNVNLDESLFTTSTIMEGNEVDVSGAQPKALRVNGNQELNAIMSTNGNLDESLFTTPKLMEEEEGDVSGAQPETLSVNSNQESDVTMSTNSILDEIVVTPVTSMEEDLSKVSGSQSEAAGVDKDQEPAIIKPTNAGEVDEVTMSLGHSPCVDGKLLNAGSLKSLGSSNLYAGSISNSIGTSHRPDSPFSTVSRPGARKHIHHQNINDAKSQQSSYLSIHRDNSMTSIQSEDSFHQPTHTVISPTTNPIPQSTSNQPRTTGRFSISSSQSIPISSSANIKKIVSRTPTRSESSHESNCIVVHQSPEPEMQFAMSDTSLHRDTGHNNIGAHQPLLLEENGVINNKYDRHVSIDPNELTTDKHIEMNDLEDYLFEVDENQRTVQSLFSVNTQDSATYEHAPLQCGNIRFVKDSVDLLQEPKKHYMCVRPDTPLDHVTEFMSRYWRKRNPKIVLSIISAADNFKPWKNQRLKDDFQKGIIKAANTTEMWIVTNGIDAGVPKIIGDAVREYNYEQENSRLISNPVMSSDELRRRRLTIMGIVPKETVPYGVYFDGTEGVQVKNVGQKPSADIYELNPDHTHFIMVEEEGRDSIPVSLRCLIEKQFRIKSGSRKKKRLMSIAGSDSEYEDQKQEAPENVIPVVGLLVQGTPRDIDHVLFYLQNRMPVVVLKGSGGIADMIVFVYEEMQEKGDSDPEYEENFLKPELIKMISKIYSLHFEDNDLGKFALRDKIIQSVKCANEGDNSFMMVVNMKGWGSSMRDLDKYILCALFKSERHEVRGQQEQHQNDLQLTIDWNRPDLAWDIFQQDFSRVRIDKKMFEQALLQKDREEFIDLFLSQGVKVHKFLNHRKLKLLFEKAQDREFFVNICLEGVLGLTMMQNQQLGDMFLSESLNRLIYKLAWVRNFIQPYELSMSSTGMYMVDSTIAERKAVNSLIIWAVLMNRHKLAKTLWNRCDEPIGVALICSRIFRELSKYKMEQYQRTELEENAKEFGKMALGALAICWRDSSIQAYNMLGKRLPDFNNKSVIEIAHDAGYIHFLAHPCCQKWLTKTFFGHLHLKELDWGIFRLPYWFKILVSAFFIFPMYIWISFMPPSQKTTYTAEDDASVYNDESDSEADDDEYVPHVSKSTFDSVMKKKKSAIGSRLKNVFSRDTRKKDVPFHMKIYLLWTAPITKFWTTQVFYFAYLGVFCLATLWPTCGNQYLDLVLWFWTAIIEMELVCRVYMKYHLAGSPRRAIAMTPVSASSVDSQKYEKLSLVGNCIDIFVIMVFLVMLLLMRILHVWISVTNYIQAKTFMCFGLIYFFYRLLGVYLPISPTLGPMLLRMNRMVKHDFIAFIRMFMIFMIVGGVTIQAVLYPNWPLNTELIKRVITRPIYAMFLTQVQDLDGNPACSGYYKNLTGYCSAGQGYYNRGDGNAKSDTLAQSLSECPHSSFSGYVITLQYLLICKLVLVTLLFAMFSLTIGKIDKEASEIWKFQRYALIADFIERFSLPPPFTVLSFIYLFIKCVCRRLMKCRHGLSHCCLKKEEKKVNRYKGRCSVKSVDDNVFWKRVAREYVVSEEAKADKGNISAKQGDILVSLQEDLRTHRKSMKRLSDRVVELERMIQSSRLYLEDIAHKLEKSEVMGITNVKGRFIHIAARQSPYPGTRRTRFPVFDKYVPWEIPYDVYDPKTITMKKDEFPENEIMFVDEDIIELHHQKEERSQLTDDDDTRLSPIIEFTPKWNAVITYKENGERREIDRRSWINIDNQPLRYTLDVLDIPQNPLGRTGMRGKGNLWRWGPNHVIKAVVTRWRRKYGPDLNTMTDYLYVEGKRVLEFIAVQKDNYIDTSYCLPGDVLHGLSSPYSILCKSFMAHVFEEPESSQYNKFDQSEMIQFFAQFASSLDGISSSITSLFTAADAVVSSSINRSTSYAQPFLSESRSNLRTEVDLQGFSASLLYKGYLDDPRNTDNAWVETEVWNFHYDIGDTFDLKLTEESSVKWKEVSPYVKMFGNESVIVQEAARIHDAYH